MNVIAFAERANAAYHEAKDFRLEHGSHFEECEFSNSGLRVYIVSNPEEKVQWVVLHGTANLPSFLGDLDFVGRDEHELGINVLAGFDRSSQECLPWVLADSHQQGWLPITGTITREDKSAADRRRRRG